MALTSLITSVSWLYALSAILLLLMRWYAYRTDTPHIKDLPEIPGWPLFGSLVALGDTHAKKFAQWAQRYGAVFQVRLGSKVCDAFEMWYTN